MREHGNRGYNGDREDRLEIERGRPMVKYHARPSLQYRYEHYDPRNNNETFGITFVR